MTDVRLYTRVSACRGEWLAGVEHLDQTELTVSAGLRGVAYQLRSVSESTLGLTA